jgi:hypothetical protein
MTRDRIAEGLELLTLQLANGDTIATPEGWQPLEWTYIKAIAHVAIWSMRARFVVAGQP